ncbi:hypothetical protein BKA83DRAFT_4203495 [Pisolithus microcarpus]|nr:hypothetical protein BKA83DRAFT_4203495 [Pisolithus microcarpus]
MSGQFDFGIRVGLVSILVATSASALAVGGVLLYIVYSAVTIQRNASRRWSTDTHVHYYFLNLMVSDLIQAVGGLLNIKWIVEESVYSGPFCTTQGFFLHVGDVAVALSTMAIALHMLQVLVLGWRSPPKFALRILAIIWLSISTLVVVPNVVQHNIYGPTGYWCWINRTTIEQIGLDYIWMWMAAVLNIISYLLLVLVVKRVVLLDGYRFRWRGEQDEIVTPYGCGRSVEDIKAIRMLFYPLVYIIVVLPISAARFSQFRGGHVPFAVTTFTDTLFALSGLFDMILYALTRPALMPRRPPHDPKSTTGPMARDGKYNREIDRSMFYDMSDFLQLPRGSIARCQV